jgi:hypothetical protein
VSTFVQWTIDDNPIAEPRLSGALCSCKGHPSHRQRTARPTTDKPLDREPLEAPSKRRLGYAFEAARDEAALGYRASDGHAGADRWGRERLMGRKREAVAADGEAPVTPPRNCPSDETRSRRRTFFDSRSSNDAVVASETAHLDAISYREVGDRADALSIFIGDDAVLG